MGPSQRLYRQNRGFFVCAQLLSLAVVFTSVVNLRIHPVDPSPHDSLAYLLTTASDGLPWDRAVISRIRSMVARVSGIGGADRTIKVFRLIRPIVADIRSSGARVIPVKNVVYQPDLGPMMLISRVWS